MNVYTVPYLDACPFSKLMKYDSFQEVKALKDLMYKKYIVQIKITKFWYISWYLNNHHLVWRPWKFEPIKFDNCKLIFGTPLPDWGSNKHPCPSFEEGYCIIETVCEWLPDIGDYQELISIKEY